MPAWSWQDLNRLRQKSSGYIEDDEKKSIFGKILSKISIARTRKWKCIMLGMEAIV